MIEFLQSNEFLVPLIGGLKAFAVCMFGLNVGVILTWAERRVRCMIQDCIGPNRAAIPLPGKVAAIALAAGPGLTAAAVVLGLAGFIHSQGMDKSSFGSVFLQGGIFMLWFTLSAIGRAVHRDGARNGVEAFIASLGSPRSIALTGITTNLLFFALSVYMDAQHSAGTGYPGAESTAGSAFVEGKFWGGTLLLSGMMALSAAHVAAQYWVQKQVRVTLLGLLHPAADGVKTAFKADFIPPNGDRLLFNLAPWITLLPALVLLAVVPFGPTMCFQSAGGQLPDLNAFTGIESVGQRCESASLSLQVADLNVGILYFFAMAGTGIVGAALAGWASDNKFSLLGGMRAASQMVSYEVTLGLSLVGALMVYGTVRVDEMILWQAENAWGIFVQPLGFFLFIAAAIAESKRIPFDLPEGESELVAGFYTEYAGMKFAMFFFSEFIAVVSSSALMVALFFGGWHLPFVTAHGIEIAWGETIYYSTVLPGQLLVLIGVLGFIGKILVLCVLQIVIRWTLPRFRYDQLMRLGWRKLLPASLFNVMATATVILAIQSSSLAVQSVVTQIAELSMVLVAVLGLAAVVGLVVFLFIPNPKQRLIVGSAARFADMMGGTREARMEA
jgi:NADH-quinone oxidoreductase subunit H